jgi:hypothetical protein
MHRQRPEASREEIGSLVEDLSLASAVEREKLIFNF